jgi:hypothetical protein
VCVCGASRTGTAVISPIGCGAARDGGDVTVLFRTPPPFESVCPPGDARLILSLVMAGAPVIPPSATASFRARAAAFSWSQARALTFSAEKAISR